MQRAAENLIEKFGYAGKKLILLVDDAFRPLAECVCALHENAQVRSFSDYAENLTAIFDLPQDAAVLLLAEPQAYVQYRIFQHLDFSGGEPAIPGADSRVLIFPADAFVRMLSVPLETDLAVRDRLIAELQPNKRYRITTDAGTDITFESRTWLPLDFEVCTAPVEETINGRIVVDGALFFKKIDEKLIFTIKNGKLCGIEAETAAGEALIEEYKMMTAHGFAEPVNTQLAEIGIGFCSGAAVSDCFMEAETAVNTCHFCFGNNVCYGGRNASEFHGASVLIRNPRFEIM